MTAYVRVLDCGVVYRLTRRSWLRWVQEFARGDSPSLASYGAVVEVDRLEATINDWTPSEAAEYLREIEKGGDS